MNIDSIQNGVVIDHITPGNGMRLYHLLGLEKINASVAIIMNATSRKMKKKDMIKVDADIPLNFDVIGFAEPGATVNLIRDGRLQSKQSIEMPEQLVDVIRCKNPRCITSCEQELPHIFRLTDREHQVYRCRYCEAKAAT